MAFAIPSHQSMAFNRPLPAPLFSVRCQATAVEVSRIPAKTSPYEVLSVKHSATPADIKKAYRRLAKLYHPDAAAANSRRASSEVDGRDFIQIHTAYETLSDPKSRAAYDLSAWTTSFHSYSSSSRRGGGGRFYPTRSWESEQCW